MKWLTQLQFSVFSVLLTVCDLTNAARILGVYNFPSPSHFQLGFTLLRELAARGHQVTMISPYPQKTPIENYTDIALPEMIDCLEKFVDYEKLREEFFFPQLLKIYYRVSQGVSVTLHSKGVSDLLKSNATFDLVIMEYFLTEPLLAIAHHFDAPAILVSTTDVNPFLNIMTQTPAPYSYVPNLFLGFTNQMNFMERLQNAALTFVMEIIATHFQPHIHNWMVKSVFPNAPNINELTNNVSLVLVNAHPSIHFSKPFVPNVVQIGGYHIQEPKPLSSDVKAFLDEATNGAIYFSLGTNLKTKKIPNAKKQSILKGLGSLQQRVLMKWDDDDDYQGEIPENVKIGSWLPQRDILAHQNVKAFITHGGMLSIMEAVYHGVPIIGIPYFGDQTANVRRSVADGYGLLLDYDELNNETLVKTVTQLLSNPRYRNVIREKSRLFRDQPLKPLDSAIYWVEYVLRHRNTRHLQSAAVRLPWYQLMLLDVLAYIAVFSTLVAYLLHTILKSVALKSKKRQLKTIAN